MTGVAIPEGGKMVGDPPAQAVVSGISAGEADLTVPDRGRSARDARGPDARL